MEVLHKAPGNIVDLLNTQRLGIKAEVFEYYQGFKAHTMKPGKRIHRATAKRARCQADIRARKDGASQGIGRQKAAVLNVKQGSASIL